MDRRNLLVVSLVVFLMVLPGRPASAGIFFGKKGNKPTPAERVPELINTLKTDGDEHKRCAAAEELRQYDAAQFPDMVPALIDALLNDKKPAVRAESAQSLGKLRPVTNMAGAALEQSLANDASMRVRLQVRSVLLQYRWAGYPPKGKEEQLSQSKEPPLAPELPVSPPVTYPQPYAPPRLTPTPMPATGLPAVPNLLPAGSTANPPMPVAVPAKGPNPTPPATNTPFTANKTTKPAEEKGPDLSPP